MNTLLSTYLFIFLSILPSNVLFSHHRHELSISLPPIYLAQATDSTTSTDSDTTPDDDSNTIRHPRLVIRGIWIIGSLIVGAIAGILAWIIRWFMQQNELSEQTKIISYFDGPLKGLTHAAKEGDQIGIATGRYKVKYPKIAVGESMMDLTGCELEGNNTLILKDGTRLSFYSQDRPLAVT